MSEESSEGRPHLAVCAWMATVPFAAAVFFAEAGTSNPWMVVWACIQIVAYILITAVVLIFLIHWVVPKLREVTNRVA